MTKSLLLLSVTGLLLTACQVGEKPSNDAAELSNTAAVGTGADEQAIRGQVDHWLQLVKSKDAAGIAALYAEDGAVMPPNAPIGKGRAAIQESWASMMQTPGFDLTFVPEQIIVSSSGDMALDRGTYTLTVAPNGTAQTDTGKYVVVWRKIGSEWKAAADIFNSDLPASGG
ncbi:MAG TPA: SgcJ/EcaC family oxidoreductase [Sphingomicrobium sp.]|nr:SgcJ/EcaC family oxidoreductase [Sphingomicrobium sp.]